MLFRKPLSLHLSVLQSRPDSNLRWRKLPVAGQVEEPERARKAARSNLERANWMATAGYRELFAD
ncbi:hypothetical protein [Mesorhizobium sp. M0678]|uniref:hypothetical protein n=1 Tax=Mesorhizobium sp. M0678 TaxID=2956985 RepID=UPI0033393157